MEREKQIELVRNFCSSVAESLIKRADTWPEHWDGYELRDLCAMAFDRERTSLMLTNRARRRAFLKDERCRFQRAGL